MIIDVVLQRHPMMKCCVSSETGSGDQALVAQSTVWYQIGKNEDDQP